MIQTLHWQLMSNITNYCSTIPAVASKPFHIFFISIYLFFSSSTVLLTSLSVDITQLELSWKCVGSAWWYESQSLDLFQSFVPKPNAFQWLVFILPFLCTFLGSVCTSAHGPAPHLGAFMTSETALYHGPVKPICSYSAAPAVLLIPERAKFSLIVEQSMVKMPGSRADLPRD